MDIKQIKYDLLIQNNLKEVETHFAIIDGKKLLTLNDFMNEMKNEFNFPNYYSENLNSFLEIMNDLSWLASSNYITIIINLNYLLINESSLTQNKLKELLSKITEEWMHVPNFENEEQYRKKSVFLFNFL
jgi:RNAse (barnase) inhibitor barstar